MKNNVIQPILAILAVIPVTLVFVIARFLFAFASVPFERVSGHVSETVFVVLHIALIAACIWLIHRQQLPFYFLISLIIGIFLAFTIGPMN